MTSCHSTFSWNPADAWEYAKAKILLHQTDQNELSHVIHMISHMNHVTETTHPQGRLKEIYFFVSTLCLNSVKLKGISPRFYNKVYKYYKMGLVHGRKVIIHWPHAKFLPLINRSVNQPPEVIIHCWAEHSKTLCFSLFLPPNGHALKCFMHSWHWRFCLSTRLRLVDKQNL